MLEACLFAYGAIVLFYVLVRILSLAGKVFWVAGLVLAPLRLVGLIGLSPKRLLVSGALLAIVKANV